jgi:hypothetical protein
LGGGGEGELKKLVEMPYKPEYMAILYFSSEKILKELEY